jgi:excisionase family DNA binding protein
METPLLLKPDDVAKALNIGRSKAYELISSGEIASITIGRCRRVTLDAIRDFVSSRQQIEAEEADG